MAYAPIALTMPQYDKDVYASWWLKAYQQGTTTPLSMATDSTGGTLLVKAQLDTAGYPLTAGAVRFTPFINGDYDLWLFPTEVEANTNDTTNAVQFADNVNADPENGIPYATLVTLTGAETLTNKTLTTPVLTTPTSSDPVMNGTLSGTAFLDEDTMSSDSAIAAASQQSIKAYVDTTVAASIPVLLDDPEIILDSTTEVTTAFVTVNNTTLNTAGARIALLSLYTGVIGGTSSSSTGAIYVEKTGATGVKTNKNLKSIAIANLTEQSQDSNSIEVGLDANYDFDYALTVTKPTGGAVATRIFLVGYIV